MRRCATCGDWYVDAASCACAARNILVDPGQAGLSRLSQSQPRDPRADADAIASIVERLLADVARLSAANAALLEMVADLERATNRD